LHTLLQNLVQGVVVSGTIATDVPAFLYYHNCPNTAQHSAKVAAQAQQLANRFAVDASLAQQAAWLHDVSSVFPAPERAHVADTLGIQVLPEERVYPPILHQKLSATVAHALFGITSAAVLSAIGCHTTLKAGASALDQVVFLADKIAWDQQGTPPYLDDLQTALRISLEAASGVYIEYLWQRRETLPIVHPWLRATRAELLAKESQP
jgi:predicted HD superfamily hydrolase involved in NAD metabolism